jgi:hypothetical protein
MVLEYSIGNAETGSFWVTTIAGVLKRTDSTSYYLGKFSTAVSHLLNLVVNLVLSKVLEHRYTLYSSKKNHTPECIPSGRRHGVGGRHIPPYG